MQELTDNLARLSPAARQFIEREKRLFIGGEWLPAASGETIAVTDPATGKRICEVPAGGKEDIDRAVGAARNAFEVGEWASMAPDMRERLIWRLADLIEANAPELMDLECIDNGMLKSFAGLDVMSAPGVLRYMAGWATKLSGDTLPVSVPIPGSRFFAYTVREPVGVVGAIVPWNVPLMLAIWKLAPALATGCTIVIKPAEDTPLATLRLAEMVAEAGIPDGVVNVVTGYGAAAGAALSEHPDVDKISFTGSTATGKKIGHAAVDTFKHMTLELGGKSPAIVFADADLSQAVIGCANSIFMNSGQVCVAGSRIYAHRSVYEQLVEGLVGHARSLKLGSGFDESSQLGPVVSKVQRDRVLARIEAGRKAGATVLTGGKASGDAGFFVEPTVLTDVAHDMDVVQEEIFGPVVNVTPFEDTDEVVALANGTMYGLAAFIWSTNINTIHNVIPRLKAGTVWVNTDQIPHHCLPGGGYKASGIGRDLGEEALHHYTENKSVLIRTA